MHIKHFFIHSSTDEWVAPTSWLLWIVLLWTYVCKYLYETLLSIGICPEVAYWTSTNLRCSSFSVLSFCLFILFMGFSRQECWSVLPFPSPVDHILSELSTMTSPSWVALHGMAHSFTELGKAVVHMIKLISFLWLWFSFCLPFDGQG